MKTRFTSKHVLVSISLGATVGAVVSVVITFLDWQANPGGIFRSDLGTDWSVVAETAASWFFPIAVVVSVLAILLIFLSLVARGRNTPA